MSYERESQDLDGSLKYNLNFQWKISPVKATRDWTKDEEQQMPLLEGKPGMNISTQEGDQWFKKVIRDLKTRNEVRSPPVVTALVLTNGS